MGPSDLFPSHYMEEFTFTYVGKSPQLSLQGMLIFLPQKKLNIVK